jgi:beta-lactamase superfamily II metal-dependent hydrolase
VAALLAFLLAGSLHAQSLELHFFNVGQGAAVLIREGGKSVLVDAGPNGTVAEYLRELGVDTLDLVVASHNHADHIGGMPSVFSSTVVRNYLENGLYHETATYQRTLAALEQSRAQYLQPSSRRITLRDARLRILPPPPDARSQNHASVGVLVEYGDFRALLTGDSEERELEHWLQHDSIPQVHVLKVSHHGADDGTTPAWANATQPSVAVISVGGTNAYGHPTARTLAIWESVGAHVYRTDLHGTIVVQAKPNGDFTVTTTTLPHAKP